MGVIVNGPAVKEYGKWQIFFFGNVSAGSQLVLNDGATATPAQGDVVNNGTIVVKSGTSASIQLGNSTLRGNGRIIVEDGAQFAINAATNGGQVNGQYLSNYGRMALTGQLLTCEGFVLENFSDLTFRNPMSGVSVPAPVTVSPVQRIGVSSGLSSSPASVTPVSDFAAWSEAVQSNSGNTTGDSTYIFRSGNVAGSAYINGDVEFLGGTLEIGTAPLGSSGGGANIGLTAGMASPMASSGITTPSTAYFIISGNLGMGAGPGTLTVHMDPTSYGQMCIGGQINLNGGNTLYVELDGGYVPPFSSDFRIFRTYSIIGALTYFTGAAPRFAVNRILVVNAGEVDYQLMNYS